MRRKQGIVLSGRVLQRTSQRGEENCSRKRRLTGPSPEIPDLCHRTTRSELRRRATAIRARSPNERLPDVQSTTLPKRREGQLHTLESSAMSLLLNADRNWTLMRSSAGGSGRKEILAPAKWLLSDAVRCPSRDFGNF